jgi:hypothetical protein
MMLIFGMITGATVITILLFGLEKRNSKHV